MNCERELRLGMVGSGLIAENRYLPILRSLPGVEVASVCDPDARALLTASRFLPGAELFPTYEPAKVLGGQALDAILVLSGGDHEAVIDDLADLRIPVYVEKPFTTVPQSAARLVEQYEKRGTLLFVAYMKQQYPAIRNLKEEFNSSAYSAVDLRLIHPPEDFYLRAVLGRTRTATGSLLQYLDSEHAGEPMKSELDKLGVTSLAARRAYVLLATSAIHELNLLHFITESTFNPVGTVFCNGGLSGRVILSSGATAASIIFDYVDSGEYEESVHLVGRHRRLSAFLPSPYLPHAPARLASSGSFEGAPATINTPMSYDDPFELNITEFLSLVRDGVAQGGCVGLAVSDQDLALRIVSGNVSVIE